MRLSNNGKAQTQNNNHTDKKVNEHRSFIKNQQQTRFSERVGMEFLFSRTYREVIIPKVCWEKNVETWEYDMDQPIHDGNNMISETMTRCPSMNF